MRGNNELHLNHATMIEVVQEWVDRNIITKPKVTKVSGAIVNGHCTTFEVNLAEREEPVNGGPYRTLTDPGRV